MLDSQEFLRGLVKPCEQAVFFEHGANGYSNAGSCRGSCGGIAHKHFLILDKVIDINMMNIHNKIKACGLVQGDPMNLTREALSEHTSDGGAYISYELDDGTGMYYPVDMLPSQFMQRIMYSYIEPTKRHMKWQERYKTQDAIDMIKQSIAEYGK